MIQVDIPAAFVIGQTFAVLSRNYLKEEPKIFTSKLLGLFNIYLSAGFATGGLFFLVGWPSWEYMYKGGWVENVYNDPQVAAFYISFLIVMILFGNFGYMLGHYWYKKSKDNYVLIGLVIGLVFTFLPFLLDWGIWNKIGTFEEIKAGGGYSFWSAPFFHGWLGIMSFNILAGVGFGILFKRLSKKLAK